MLPEYKGSTFRGALGHAFRQVACALRRQTCDGCLLRERCAYSVCFETPVPKSSEIMRKYPRAPHPFILEPPLEDRCKYEPGEELAVGLVLVGTAQDHLPHFIYAFDEMAKGGLGRNRGKTKLLGVETETRDGEIRTLYDGQNERLSETPVPLTLQDVRARAEDLRNCPVRLTFETPMRLMVEGRLSMSPELSALLPSLLRRLSLLEYFFCKGTFVRDIDCLLAAGSAVKLLRSEVTWKDWTRYSSRQKTTMEFGGFMGWAEYDSMPEEILDALAWGERLHLGKASAFGLGKYRMERM